MWSFLHRSLFIFTKQIIRADLIHYTDIKLEEVYFTKYHVHLEIYDQYRETGKHFQIHFPKHHACLKLYDQYQWRYATEGSCPLNSEEFAKNQEKEGENKRKSGKKRGKEEKIGKVLSLYPS